MGLPAYRNTEDGDVQAAEYRVWVRAPEHVRPVDGVSYDAVPTERLSAVVGERGAGASPALGLGAAEGGQRSRARGAVLHAVDCAEARRRRRWCPWSGRWTSRAARHSTVLPARRSPGAGPVLRGFDHIGDG
ncbi:hypothetical protein GCM10010353_68950 [Streptomyces chryseus]|nr:hypothetical protein GCM10010353_68950 [Streptomyces chryseus]